MQIILDGHFSRRVVCPRLNRSFCMWDGPAFSEKIWLLCWADCRRFTSVSQLVSLLFTSVSAKSGFVHALRPGTLLVKKEKLARKKSMLKVKSYLYIRQV
jgi:hypothetical protein